VPKKKKLTSVVDDIDNIESYHLLSMFESANFELLNENDSLLSLYLNDTEIEIANLNFDSTKVLRDRHGHQYHLIEKSNVNDETVLFIGRSIIGNGRNYSILFRILDNQNKILNTVTVAAWNESRKNFYGCEVVDNWSKIRHVNNGKVIREFTIDEQWKIKQHLTKNKPH
jgi:hypothetical protein